MHMQTRLEQEVTRAQELRAALHEESVRIEQNLVDYRRRVGLVNQDDDEAEFAAQAAYQARRKGRRGNNE